MIKHIVLLKLKDNTPILELRKNIEDLRNDIEEIVSIKTATDIGYDKDASDLAIIATFKNKKDLDIYANHPKHIEVIKLIKKFLIERRVIDYEDSTSTE